MRRFQRFMIVGFGHPELIGQSTVVDGAFKRSVKETYGCRGHALYKCL